MLPPTQVSVSADTAPDHAYTENGMRLNHNFFFKNKTCVRSKPPKTQSQAVQLLSLLKNLQGKTPTTHVAAKPGIRDCNVFGLSFRFSYFLWNNHCRNRTALKPISQIAFDWVPRSRICGTHFPLFEILSSKGGRRRKETQFVNSSWRGVLVANLENSLCSLKTSVQK